MAEGARVESIEALGRFRIAMIKFAETLDVALADAEGELTRTGVWLETEQLAYWQTQLRHRHEAVEKAREAVRMKKLFKDSSGRTPSAVEEEKALKVAQRRLEEAEQKLAATRKYIKVLQREFQLYKGGVQKLSTTLADAIPTGVATLGGFVDQLQRYVGFGPSTVASEAAPHATTTKSDATTDGASMARPEPASSSQSDSASSSQSDSASSSVNVQTTPAGGAERGERTTESPVEGAARQSSGASSVEARQGPSPARGDRSTSERSSSKEP